MFKRHLNECLTGYFIIKKGIDKAFFNLGKAIHGITDSFCPAHKGFQYFSLENVLEHRRLDNGKLSPRQEENSKEFITKMYNDLDDLGVSIDHIIENWEEAYTINLRETE